MDGKKRMNMAAFADKVQAKRVKMASAESLFEKMRLLPGMVSPFGLLNNYEKDIKVYFDRDILTGQRMSFHPNTNEKTIFLDPIDLINYIKSIGYDIRTI